MSDQRYNLRGVSASKEDVHNAIKNIDKGIFPQAFCKIIPVDDGGDHFTRNQQLVASDGGGNQYVVYGAHAQQVVDIHYQSILRDTFPYGQVSGFFPVHISQR